eukprot:6753749-Lingulodinium_polyedra.AAC.1
MRRRFRRGGRDVLGSNGRASRDRRRRRALASLRACPRPGLAHPAPTNRLRGHAAGQGFLDPCPEAALSLAARGRPGSGRRHCP